ncbi:MAG: type II secretion system secretin GspD [Pseudohongiella nitratireducens]|nr:type II secretion system secretin GspD [Pseudohongiella nitratireducens]MDF1623322.1 type II secretion system secretin GspD [Pseudohongiella nitratireducens]
MLKRTFLPQLFLVAVIKMSSGATLAQENITWTPNFRDSDIMEVIRVVQDVTGKTMVVDPRVTGTITVMSNQAVDADSYYDIFLRALDLAGFTAVETEPGLVSILPSQEARSAALPIGQSVQGGRGQNSGYVTETIRLDNIAVNDVLPVLRPLVSQSNGQMSAFPDGNMLLLVDTASNVRRIREVLAQLDQGVAPETEIVSLKFAIATDVVELVREMQQGRRSTPAEEGSVNRLGINADPRTNSVLISGSARQREQLRTLVEQLDRPREQTGNTRVVYLEYANAERLAGVLGQVVENTFNLNQGENSGGNNSSVRQASIEADPDNNALIITADMDIIESLMDVVHRLDIQRAQVLVEAIIVEINDDTGQNLGIQWLFRDDSGAFASSFEAGNNLTQLGQIAEGALNEDREEGLTSLAAGLAATAGQTIGIGRIGSSNDLLALVDMLQATSGANILSTPNILTTDNSEAVITVGENVPFVTGSYTGANSNGNVDNPFQTITRENVGTTLRVTPHVNQGNNVALDINQEISSISQRAGAVDLITNERKIETRVTVADGEIVVLGGLIRDNIIQSESKIPLLGDVPGLGRLFRSNSSSVQKTNLLVFIRPTILRDDLALRGATAEKYQQIRNQQIQQQSQRNILLDSLDMPVLPEWSSQLPTENSNDDTGAERTAGDNNE